MMFSVIGSYLLGKQFATIPCENHGGFESSTNFLANGALYLHRYVS